MSADFTPSLNTYTDLTPFRFWCQKILPIAYDDSLSYYELLCKVVDYLNKTMEDVELSIEDVEKLHDAYAELQTYVNTYFANLDVQEEINNKLDVLVADGTIHDIFNDDVMAILTQAQAATQQAINNIPTVVGTWLGQHVTPETGYVIDDSLTTKNAAADALATGVADNNIKSAVELAFFGEIEDDDFVQGYRTQADYYTVHNQTTRCASAKYYHVYPGDTISISNIADGTKSAILGAGKTSATNYDSGWKTADFTYTAVNELIVFIEAAKSDDTADILVSDVTTVFTLVDKSTRITDNENAIGELKSDLSDDGQNTDKQISVSPNKILSGDIVWNEYTTGASIIQNAGASYGHTAPIYVNKEVEYKFKVSGQFGTYATAYMRVVGGNYVTGGSLGTASDGYVTFTPDFNGFIIVNVHINGKQMLCKTDEYPVEYIDGKYINTKLSETNSDISEMKQLIFTDSPISATIIYDGGCYITVGGYISTSSSTEQRLFAAPIVKDVKYSVSAHLITNSTETIYAFYNKQTIPQPGDTAYDNTQHSHAGEVFTITAPITGWIVFRSKAGYNDETITPVIPNDVIARTTKNDNPLFAKMIAVDGDSICYGNGYAGGYAKIIADKNSMYYENKAVGGATIVTGTQSSGVDRHWISTSMQTLSENADYILIEGGANDSSMSSVVLGSLTSSYNATLDTTTFYGAMETIFKTLTTKYVGKKCGFIIVHGILHSFMPGGDFYNAVYDCAAKWGVPILDLTKYVPPFNQFRHDEALNTVRSTYTTDGDGWHPTETCYRNYYVPIIEEWMKTL